MLLSDISGRISRAGKAARWPFEIADEDAECAGLLRLIVAAPQGMVDLATGLVATRSGSADPCRINSDGGLDAYFDGVDDQYTLGTAGDAVNLSQPFTVVWESELDAFVDAYPVLAQFRTGNAGDPLRVFYSSDASYDDITVAHNTANRHAFLMPSGISRTGDRHWAVWSYNGQGFSTGSNHRMWINGLECALTASSSIGSVTDDNRVGGSSISTTDWNGSIRQVRLYDRAWEQADAIRFWHPSSRDSLFRRPPAFFAFPLSGGGAADLVGAATASASASGSLTTQIPIAGGATVVATANGTLTTGIPLAGGAATVALASGVLTASIRLSGAALAQVLTSATLAGGAAALAGAASASASGAASLTTGIRLAGAATAGASGSAPLTTQIRLAGAAVMQALATAGLTTVPSGLAGGATASASGTGALSTAVRLVGQASAIAIGAGGLTTGIALTGSAAAACHATGDLTIASSFSAAALAQVAASGTLSTHIRLNAAAVAQALATASLASGGAVILLADTDYLARQPRRQHVARRDRRSWMASRAKRSYAVRSVA